MNALETKVARLYSELVAVGEEYEEANSPEVREAVAEVVNYCFVQGEEPDDAPINYEMDSAEANREVARIVRRFIDEALPLAEKMGVQPGEARFELLQNTDLREDDGAEFWWPAEDEELEEIEKLSKRRFEQDDDEDDYDYDDDEDEDEDEEEEYSSDDDD